MSDAKIDRLLPLLCCPETRQPLVRDGDVLRTEDGAHRYSVRDGQVFFIDGFAVNDPLDQIKWRLKKTLGDAYYKIGVALLAPTYPLAYLAEIQKYHNLDAADVVDLGSGNVRLHPRLITMDATALSDVSAYGSK